MKVELTLVLKTTERAYETLEQIKNAGFNATVMSSESLRHAVDYYPGEHHFINLRHIAEKDMLESILCLFVIDQSRLEELKAVIRHYTSSSPSFSFRATAPSSSASRPPQHPPTSKKTFRR